VPVPPVPILFRKNPYSSNVGTREQEEQVKRDISRKNDIHTHAVLLRARPARPSDVARFSCSSRSTCSGPANTGDVAAQERSNTLFRYMFQTRFSKFQSACARLSHGNARTTDWRGFVFASLALFIASHSKKGFST
jgi:hypothetical protein